MVSARDDDAAATSPPVPMAGQVVGGNRWDHLDVPELGTWTPTRRLTVVLPYYEAPAALEITLAALTQQTYPSELVQVVVADDGSSPPLELPAAHRGLDLAVVHQEDRGFGLARARNTGARSADGDILVFLDCDMVPEPDHLEAHARWHHACQHAVTLGFRTHVEFDRLGPDDIESAARDGALSPLFDGLPRTEPAWIERHMERMAELTGGDDDLFRAVTGGNLGIRAETFWRAGGFDESFTQWGSEDTDLGHRLFLGGALLIPERRAACWHQGDSRGLETHERASLDEQRAKLSQLVPHPGFRRLAPGRSFRVPRVLVEVEVGDEPHAQVTGTLESVLASDLHDLEVLLTIPDDHADRVRLEREWSGDPRVVTHERDEHARTPYRVRAPVGTAFERHAVDAIVAALSDTERPLGVLRLTLPDEPPDRARLLAVSTRALARARTVGADDPLATAATLFGQRWASGDEFGVSWAPVDELRRVPRWRPPARTTSTTPLVAPSESSRATSPPPSPGPSESSRATSPTPPGPPGPPKSSRATSAATRPSAAQAASHRRSALLPFLRRVLPDPVIERLRVIRSVLRRLR